MYLWRIFLCAFQRETFTVLIIYVALTLGYKAQSLSLSELPGGVYSGDKNRTGQDASRLCQTPVQITCPEVMLHVIVDFLKYFSVNQEKVLHFKLLLLLLLCPKPHLSRSVLARSLVWGFFPL